MSGGTLPDELRDPMARAVRLQVWHIFWLATIVVAMGLVMGQSQTMKTAWIEDTLSLVPPIAFLIAARLERRRGRSDRFPFGFERATGLGFFVAAVALVAVGGVLLVDSAMTLAMAEHATVGSVRLLGHDVWLGWPMIAAQLYGIVPPLVIGRMELPLARTLQDKLLHTDALMSKANWLTGLGGVAGIVGLGLGWWWADAAAAILISADIIHDGVTAVRAASAELVDGAPRELGGSDVAGDARAVQVELYRRFPEATTIRLRETGRLIRAEVHGVPAPEGAIRPRDYWPGERERAWRLAQVSFVPPEEEGERQT